jgi:hypothetical protein
MSITTTAAAAFRARPAVPDLSPPSERHHP